MLSDFFGEVDLETGTVVAMNIRRGGKYKGKQYGLLSPDRAYAEDNLFPQVEIRPEPAAGQKLKLPVGTWDAVNRVVKKVFAVEDVSVSQRLNELAQLRYEKEIAGITVNGSQIKTDRESQAKINGAYNAVQLDPARVIDFKAQNGWVKLDKAAIEALSATVADYVQACYTREEELTRAIGMDINTDITTGWPAREIS